MRSREVQHGNRVAETEEREPNERLMSLALIHGKLADARKGVCVCVRESV